MEPHRELIELVREQVQIEKESAARLGETESKVGTGAAKLLLVEMRCDSQKHAAILEAILEALEGGQSSKPLWQQAFSGFADPIIVKREIEIHKTLGKSMVAHIQKEMSKTDDEAVRTLLQHLTEDEKRHSEILDTIAQRCYSMIR
ncbi:MAG: ferritin family protein [Candidatus Bathyarchaeia archaeon]